MNATRLAIISALVLLSQTTAALAEPLIGGIEVEDRLSPLPPNIAPGKFLPENILRSSASEDWFKVPSWLAGRWRTVHTLQLSTIDQLKAEESETIKTVPMAEEETFGFQSDNRHQVWTPVQSLSFTQSTQTPSSDSSVKSRRTNDFMEGTENNFRIRTTDLEVAVELREDKLIKSIEREQIIRSLHRLDGETIAALCLLRAYDVTGIPISTTRQVRIMRKIAQYSPQQTFDDRDLKSAFTKFLERSGFANLIPQRSND